MGLFRVPELRRAGGEVEPEPDPLEPVATTGLEVETVLIGSGATAAEGLMRSVQVVGWWWW